ncbi:hypothetical protein BZA70DRAFT_308862 [Myxozyma melibiosi]|uniref:Uncharacterized protein n=1 Tax=Myxozyma melibiosi TaxID=54550 RepID=A0ABR1FE44_9ASCO
MKLISNPRYQPRQHYFCTSPLDHKADNLHARSIELISPSIKDVNASFDMNDDEDDCELQVLQSSSAQQFFGSADYSASKLEAAQSLISSSNLRRHHSQPRLLLSLRQQPKSRALLTKPQPETTDDKRLTYVRMQAFAPTHRPLPTKSELKIGEAAKFALNQSQVRLLSVHSAHAECALPASAPNSKLQLSGLPTAPTRYTLPRNGRTLGRPIDRREGATVFLNFMLFQTVQQIW